ncbi:MAG: bifunctional 3-phosphoshikimate 1-carboxyvinyltransferase/cytidylate kinase [Zoogloeaceae bacterium]|jgi:3-phosphoshikimate 1-carboxyvinyltransferase|nr:bifunctional 3-phosphoshikimate 1-carboxyvinyltransferase/cytidylate kinase [Zoogloeaceae bacterium]
MRFLDLPQMISASGSVTLPGSKSISNRALLLAALAEGVTELHSLLDSDDTARMREALSALGVEMIADNGVLRVTGCGGRFPARQASLFLGNAGTAFRSLTAALAFCGGEYTLDGVPRMRERPIGDLVDALRCCGARIEYAQKEGFPPLRIYPSAGRPDGVVKIRGDVSSQFLSGLLMALPLSGAQTRVAVEGTLISRPYVAMTLNLMARFGVTVAQEDGRAFSLPSGARYRAPGRFFVEGDASSASYFLALGAIGATADSPVRVEGVGKNALQGDAQFAEVLAEMGARVTWGENWISAAKPADGKPLTGIRLDANAIPDAAMTLAVAALYAQGETELANIASWRVKETDRIAAMSAELRRMNVRVEEGADFLKIIPPDAEHPVLPALIHTYEDHRMAMCFSLAAFAAPLRILDPCCVAKTFPKYFECLERVTRPAPVIAMDGPTASGKGTVSSRVARALGFHYLDSGALYRLTALEARNAGVDWADEAAVAELAERLDVSFRGDRVFLRGQDVSQIMREERISVGASKVAALPAVRSALLFRQRAFHRAPGLVGDGRDMASVVFPRAALKVFLTASAEIRAERRVSQLRERGEIADFSVIRADLEARDARDRSRAAAPLVQAEDAVLLDTDALGIEEAVMRVLDWYAEKDEAGKAR